MKSAIEMRSRGILYVLSFKSSFQTFKKHYGYYRNNFWVRNIWYSGREKFINETTEIGSDEMIYIPGYAVPIFLTQKLLRY
jgi:hypothetical protein